MDLADVVNAINYLVDYVAIVCVDQWTEQTS